MILHGPCFLAETNDVDGNVWWSPFKPHCLPPVYSLIDQSLSNSVPTPTADNYFICILLQRYIILTIFLNIYLSRWYCTYKTAHQRGLFLLFKELKLFTIISDSATTKPFSNTCHRKLHYSKSGPTKTWYIHLLMKRLEENSPTENLFLNYCKYLCSNFCILYFFWVNDFLKICMFNPNYTVIYVLVKLYSFLLFF